MQAASVATEVIEDAVLSLAHCAPWRRVRLGGGRCARLLCAIGIDAAQSMWGEELEVKRWDTERVDSCWRSARGRGCEGELGRTQERGSCACNLVISGNPCRANNSSSIPKSRSKVKAKVVRRGCDGGKERKRNAVAVRKAETIKPGLAQLGRKVYRPISLRAIKIRRLLTFHSIIVAGAKRMHM